MTIRKYLIELTGVSPLLLHHDDIDWADAMKAWGQNSANKKESVAGDDRSPAFRWLGCLYHDDAVVTLPQDNIMRCLMEGGAQVPVPGAKGNKTFKSQTQSGMMLDDAHWPLVVAGNTLPVADLHQLREEKDFSQHRARAIEMGFTLFVKRAKVGTSKHVRVRPRFNNWSCRGTVSVWDEQITLPVLTDIVTFAGRYKGLGDWRPGGKTPGPFGMFTAAVSEVRA